MSDKVNQRYGIPRIPGGEKFSFSRGKFLDGTAKTYFGPGQRPGLLFSYSPPGDWPKAGTLLRVPRVVWLNTWMEQGAKTNPITQVWDNFYTTPQLPGQPIAFFDFSVVPPRPYYKQAVGDNVTETPNSDYIERQRLLGVFQVVKDRVESIQAGRTWVEIVDWNNTDAFDADSNPYGSGGYDGDGFMQVAAPPHLPGPFFGVDVLNVWVGGAMYDQGGLRSQFAPYEPGSPPSSEPLYGRPSSRLIGSYGQFRRHETRLYHPDQGWSTPGPTPDPAGLAPTYVPYEDTEPLKQGFNADQYDFYSAELGDYGFSHAGGSSLVTADSLLGLIASHYGFEPDTGAELG